MNQNVHDAFIKPTVWLVIWRAFGVVDLDVLLILFRYESEDLKESSRGTGCKFDSILKRIFCAGKTLPVTNYFMQLKGEVFQMFVRIRESTCSDLLEMDSSQLQLLGFRSNSFVQTVLRLSEPS